MVRTLSYLLERLVAVWQGNTASVLGGEPDGLCIVLLYIKKKSFCLICSVSIVFHILCLYIFSY